MTTTSPLVQRAIIAAAAEMETEVALFGVPVDLPGRAVVFATAPVRLVLKVDTNPNRIVRESKALQHLAAVAQVPQHWFMTEPDANTDNEPWILATSYVDGDRLSHSAPDSAWVDLGRQLANIHQADCIGWDSHPSKPASANKWATELVTQAHDAGIVDEKIATAFLTQTVSESLPERDPCLIHGEMTSDHAFIDGDGVSALIDLGDCGVGDPVYDLATATLWNQDKLSIVLGGYSEAGGFISDSPELRVDVNRFQLIRLLAGALWLHRYEFTTTPYVGELYERLLAGLADS